MEALKTLVASTLALTEDGWLDSPFDPDWRSPAEHHQDQDRTYWRPVTQSNAISFDGLAHALELDIHPDICAYYSTYWSGTLPAKSQEGPVDLIQLWNMEDFDRLIANLIGHAMAKQRRKLPFTVFFANTDPDSELFLSIDNATGAILLEEPSGPPLRTIETDIHTFLARLEPDSREPDLY